MVVLKQTGKGHGKKLITEYCQGRSYSTTSLVLICFTLKILIYNKPYITCLGLSELIKIFSTDC